MTLRSTGPLPQETRTELDTLTVKPHRVCFGFKLVLLIFLSTSLLTAAPPQTPPSPMPQNPSPMVETTRPHPRLTKREAPGQRFNLSTGTLYLAPGFRPRAKVPLVVHFHGAPWLVEHQLAEAWPQAALITVQLGAGSGIYSRTFAEPTRLTEMLAEALTHLRQQGRPETDWRSLTLTSFSAGYGAIRSILQQPEHYSRIDGVLLADSLHTSYVPEGKPAQLETNSLEVFARFAREAVVGRKAMFITHSEVYPGTFGSTTETADYLLSRVTGRRVAVLRPGPIGMQQLSYYARGKFYLAGFAGNSAPDHMDHLYGLSEWLRKMK